MNMRDIWFSIDKSGQLNILQFKMFCSIVELKLEEGEYAQVVKIFGKTITYQNFKLFIKFC